MGDVQTPSSPKRVSLGEKYGWLVWYSALSSAFEKRISILRKVTSGVPVMLNPGGKAMLEMMGELGLR